VKRWEEAPIPVPERLVKEVEDVLEKVFLGFSVFSVSRGDVGYEGSQPLLPTDETPRNRENRETEKQESSTSFQDGKSDNEAGTGLIFRQEPSENKQFREFHKFTDFTGSQASEGGQGAPQKSRRTGEVGELAKGTFPDSSESGKVEVETGSQETLLGSERVSSMKKEERSVHQHVKKENEQGCPYWNGEYCGAAGYAPFRSEVLEKGRRPPCLGGSDKCPWEAWRQAALRKKRQEEEMAEEAAEVWGV
jgi:hypothetical protein